MFEAAYEKSLVVAKAGVVIIRVVIGATGQDIVRGVLRLGGEGGHLASIGVASLSATGGLRRRRRGIIIAAEVEAEVACNDGKRKAAEGYWERFLRRLGLGHTFILAGAAANTEIGLGFLQGQKFPRHGGR